MSGALNSDLEAWGAGIVALWLVGGSAYRWFIKPRQELRRLQLADEMRQAIKADTASLMRPVHQELRPNGGSSFRDEVNAQLEILTAEITVLAESTKMNTDSIAKIMLDQQKKGR